MQGTILLDGVEVESCRREQESGRGACGEQVRPPAVAAGNCGWGISAAPRQRRRPAVPQAAAGRTCTAVDTEDSSRMYPRALGCRATKDSADPSWPVPMSSARLEVGRQGDGTGERQRTHPARIAWGPCCDMGASHNMLNNLQ